MRHSRFSLRARTLLAVPALGATLVACSSPTHGAREDVGPSVPAQASRRHAASDYLRLKIRSAAVGETTTTIALHALEDYDGWTREQIYALRRARVGLYPSLVAGDYQPTEAVFGLIEDGRPWWGTNGQFCLGRGETSIEGPSEESRFIGNPFLLLGVDEGKGFNTTNPGCRPVYPEVVSLQWNASAATATATYDYTSFLRGKAEVGLTKYLDCLDLESYNARDMGFAFARLDVPASVNIAPCPGSDAVILLRRFLHKGGSCRYPGGCNNGSPDSPGLRFRVESVPARVVCRLWGAHPASAEDAPDFTFTIALN
jgi:hypothetical protein